MLFTNIAPTTIAILAILAPSALAVPSPEAVGVEVPVAEAAARGPEDSSAALASVSHLADDMRTHADNCGTVHTHEDGTCGKNPRTFKGGFCLNTQTQPRWSFKVVC
ncbi:hypothetical protein CKAH01_06316 [Colletotrichum kahawae]|uniref:Uncharacterized protein n=1 Tax=Colletotrichum kahawae TaxID=34407 RepID=A0AAD9YAT7_COLKA|nr:hypothetical protein CKAH01_06316 [Colletotrichum kahawae]